MLAATKVEMVTSFARQHQHPLQCVMENMIAQELEVSLHMAFVEARQKRHEFITVEHLLLALLDNPSAAEVLRAVPRRSKNCASSSPISSPAYVYRRR